MVKLFGFQLYAYKGLETGERDISATAVKNGNVIFVFMGAIRPLHAHPANPLIDAIHNHISIHGDGVKDVAMQASNLQILIDNLAVKNSLSILQSAEPTVINDEFGTIKFLTINAENDLIHTIIDRSDYKGFLPGFKLYAINNEGPKIHLNAIDHCVQNQDWNKMLETCEFYKKNLNFHKFWSVDENQVFTEFSALKSTVMTSENEVIKMPVNEPAIGLKKSQIEEFIEFNHGPGIQHIAIEVDDIIDTIKKMRKNGVEFINVPDQYYKNIAQKIKANKHPKFKESLKSIKKYGILIDFDENGYLLQLFTRSIFERPTFFFEIIQRNNHNGFGAGNFKGLFEVLEKEQELRGNLVEQDVNDRLRGLKVESDPTNNDDIKVAMN